MTRIEAILKLSRLGGYAGLQDSEADGVAKVKLSSKGDEPAEKRKVEEGDGKKAIARPTVMRR